MKLLGYQQGFINQLNIEPIVNNLDDIKQNKQICACGSRSYCCWFNMNKYRKKKTYVNVRIMDYHVEKLLSYYDTDITELIINNSNILGLLDLKKFTKLKKLICSSNEIMCIINLPECLEYLDISFNILKNIDINHLVNLKYLKCSYNKFNQISLPVMVEFFDCTENLFSDTFEGLDLLTMLHTFICSDNKINKIVFSKSNPLKKLDITNNRFIRLENIPDSVEFLNCSYNSTINLNFGLPKELKILNCSNCYLTKLDNLPYGLKELTCSSNQIDSLDNLPCGLNILYCRENKITYLDYLPDSIEILFVGANKSLKNLDNLNTGLKELECDKCLILNSEFKNCIGIKQDFETKSQYPVRSIYRHQTRF